MQERTYRLRKADLTWRAVGDAIVVLDLSDSTYLSVSGSGRTIWGCLENGATHAELVAAVVEVYDVDDPVAHDDTSAFLADLERRGLLAAL